MVDSNDKVFSGVERARYEGRKVQDTIHGGQQTLPHVPRLDISLDARA